MLELEIYDSITRSYRRERKGVGTIGLDWLLGVKRVVSLVLKGIPATLVSSAWPSPHLSPHSSPPQSFSSPHSTSI